MEGIRKNLAKATFWSEITTISDRKKKLPGNVGNHIKAADQRIQLWVAPQAEACADGKMKTMNNRTSNYFKVRVIRQTRGRRRSKKLVQRDMRGRCLAIEVLSATTLENVTASQEVTIAGRLLVVGAATKMFQEETTRRGQTIDAEEMIHKKRRRVNGFMINSPMNE